MWSLTNESASGLECSFQPTCWFCGADMEAVRLAMLNFTLKERGEKKIGRAIDVDVMCPQCGCLDVFGVAVDGPHQVKVLRRLYEQKNTNPPVGEDRGEKRI